MTITQERYFINVQAKVFHELLPDTFSDSDGSQGYTLKQEHLVDQRVKSRRLKTRVKKD